MFGSSRFKSEACEIQCKLCLARIKMNRNKRTIQLQQSRKEVATLLETGKQDYARIRVEGVIREQLMLQAYEILELYIELLSVRAQLVAKTKEIPRDMVEAISSIIYTAQRVGSDLPELQKLRKMFDHKYGQQYVQEASADATCGKWQVNANLIRCLLVEPPEPALKLQTLSEIAQDHQVEWDAASAHREMLPPAAVGAPVSGSVPAPGFPGMQDDIPPPMYAHMGGPSGVGMAPAASGMGAPAPPGTHSFTSPGGTQYANAGQAASAAAQAAQQARAAADYAAQFAMAQAGMQVPGHGGGAAAATADGSAAPVPVQAAPPPPPPAGPDGGVPATGWLATPSPLPPPDAAASSGAFGTRTREEIQQAYDQAQGPPTKAASATAPPAPPAPPPPPPVGDLPVPPRSPAAAAGPPPPPPAGSMGLPAPPSAGVQPGAPGDEDEYTVLARRLEALKRT